MTRDFSPLKKRVLAGVCRQFFTTVRRQILPIFDPSPPIKCRRLKWMVHKLTLFQLVGQTMSTTLQIAPPSDF